MKNTPSHRSRALEADMPAEYQLDWSKAKPNPYAARLKDTVAVVLAPDVAEVFPTTQAVNTFCAASSQPFLEPGVGRLPGKKLSRLARRANKELERTRSTQTDWLPRRSTSVRPTWIRPAA